MPTHDILLDCKERMEKAADFFAGELRGLRTARASTALVEFLKVDYYGTPTELRQIASIAVPEPNMIVIKPFDPGSVKDIERAIRTSDIGITPSSDGKILRLPVPALSTERRQQIAAQVRKMAEQARVAVRSIRRDANKEVDKEEKDKVLPEDDADKCKDEIQKLTDEYSGKVDEIFQAKNKEIMDTQ